MAALALGEASELHLSELAAHGASPATIRQYRSIQRGYILFLRETLGVTPTVDHLTVALARRWLLHLAEHGRQRSGGRGPQQAGKPCSAETRSLYLSCLKSLSRFLSTEDADDGMAYLRSDPLAKAKPAKRDPKPVEVLTEDEFGRLLAVCQGTRWMLRNRAILFLLHSTGLRISELCALTINDIELASDKLPQGSVRVRRGKGDKARSVPIPFGQKTSNALAKYLTHAYGRRKSDSADASPWLFFGQGGERLQPAAFRHLLDELADQAAIYVKRVTPHSFRRTAATNWARAGVGITVIAEYLGHSSLEHVRRYVRTAALLEVHTPDPVDRMRGVR